MIHPNIQLVTADYIATIRGVSREAIYALADGAGEDSYLWVFNVASRPDNGDRDLRFWVKEINSPAETRKLKLEEVIRQIVPRRDLPGQFCGLPNWQVSDLLRVYRQHLLNLRKELQPVEYQGGMWTPRANLEKFFYNRWCYHGHKPIQMKLA